MKHITLLLLLAITLFGEEVLKIATYNVDNLFDLKRGGYEYEEYIPYTRSNWNKKTYNIKLKHLSRVIKEIDASIIALEEVESLDALKDLRYKLKQKGLYYPYYKIADKKNTTVKVAILSKIPFVYTREIKVTYSYKYRNILEAKFNINGNELYLFVNHWKSKSAPESMRIVSAKALRKRLEEIGYDKNIIILGDFNSDYEEYIKFKRKRKLNDTNGYTGINHVLRTIKLNQKANKVKYIPKNLYNLWYDTDEKQRYSYIFRGKKEALDSIIVSQPLLNKKGISYIHGSIHSFKRDYLFWRKKINRWVISYGRNKRHRGLGYSDHLPVVAKFKAD